MILQKYNGLWETIINNHTPSNWILKKKWITSEKHSSYQDWILKNYKIWADWVQIGYWINFKTYWQTKVQDKMASLVNSTKHLKKIITNSSQTLSKIRIGGKHFQILLTRPAQLWNKNQIRTLQKKKVRVQYSWWT